MLEKLLSKLKSQKSQNPNPQPLENLSPNLLNNVFSQISTYRPISNLQYGLNAFVNVMKVLIGMSVCVFLLSVLINILAAQHLRELTNEVNDKALEVYKKSLTENTVNDVYRKIELYKQLKAGSPLLYDKVNAVLKNIPSVVRIDTAGIDQKSAFLSLSSSNVLAFTLVINNLLADPMIKELILESVALNSSNNSYTVALQTRFR